MTSLPGTLYHGVKHTETHTHSTGFYADPDDEALQPMPEGFVLKEHEPYYTRNEPPVCLHALGQLLVNALFKEILFLRDQVKARDTLLDVAGIGGDNIVFMSILRRFLRYSFKPVRAQFDELTGEERRIFGHPELFQQFLDWAGYTKL